MHEPAADLVEHGQLGGADVVGAPQLLDGRQQPPARVVAVGRRALVELVQHVEHA